MNDSFSKSKNFKKRRGSVAATIAVLTEENSTNKKTWLLSQSMLQDFVKKRQGGAVHPLQAGSRFACATQ